MIPDEAPYNIPSTTTATEVDGTSSGGPMATTGGYSAPTITEPKGTQYPAGLKLVIINGFTDGRHNTHVARYHHRLCRDA